MAARAQARDADDFADRGAGHAEDDQLSGPSADGVEGGVGRGCAGDQDDVAGVDELIALTSAEYGHQHLEVAA